MQNETTNTVPNLDAMNRDELEAFQDRWSNASDEEAEALIGRPGGGGVARRLAGYAMLKSAAIRHRLAGSIDEAQAYEQHCDEEYATLPEDLKW